MSGIFVLQGNEVTELLDQPFETEDVFQRLLAAHPNLLAGGQVRNETPRRWLLVRREMDVPGEEAGAGRWALDHLFLDQDGVPTLVEVKRISDTRIRREIVGQMLDYAANAVAYWPAEEIQRRFLARCEAQGLDPADELSELLQDENDVDSFWNKVKTNLHARRIRMLFVADVVPPELRRIVEFLNEQMDPAEVLALEIRQYGKGELRTLVPRIIGQTAEAEGKKRLSNRPAKIWNEDTFFAAAIERCSPPIVPILQRLYEWARSTHTIRWGGGQTYGSFSVQHERTGLKVLWVSQDGSISPMFSNLKKFPPFEDRDERRALLVRLNTIPGVNLPEDSVDKTWPNIDLHSLKSPAGVDHFIRELDRALEQIDVAAGHPPRSAAQKRPFRS
jgi:hypothetical protein